MHFRKILQQIKISRCKPFTSFSIGKYNYYKASGILPTKTFNKPSNSKLLKNEIIQSHSSKNTFEELAADSSIFSMIISKDEWFYGVLYPNLIAENYEESIISDLQNSYSIEDLFEVLDKHKKPLNYDEACQAIYSLSNIKHLRQLKFKNSLMHIKHNRHFFSVVCSYPKFYDILEIIKDKSSLERLCPLMMCLDNIGVDLNHNLMIDLHLKVLKSISDLDILSLIRLSFVFIGRSIVSYYTQVNIFNEVYKKIDFDELSVTNLLFLSVLYNNMHRIISLEEKHQYVHYVQTFLDEKRFSDSDITNLLIILNTFNKLFVHSAPVYTCKNVMKLFINKIDHLTPHQLSLLSSTYLNVLEPRCLLPKLQEAASSYINDSDNFSLKTDLLLCLSFNARFKKKKEYEYLAAEIVNIPYECQDASSLFKALRFLKISNYELCNKFWSNSIENIKSRLAECEETIGFREGILRLFYAKYIYFNNNIRGRVRIFEIEQEMISLLQSEIKGSVKHIPSKIAHMISFLIAYSKGNELSEEWYELLEKDKAQLRYFDIRFLSRGLEVQLHNNVHNKKGAQLLSKFKSLLDYCTEDILKDNVSLREVMSLTTGYLIREGSPSAALFQKLSDAHLKYLDEIISVNITQILRNFSNAKFMNPEVFEAISDYIISNQEDVSSTVVHQVLSSFFILGYIPKRNEFVDACQTVVNAEREVMSCKTLLHCCLALAFLRGLTTDLIHYIFCVEFLDQIEEEMEYINSLKYSNSVRSLLMRLNRSVCLDYPEEKIPWFHEKYCQDMVEMKPKVPTAFMKEVASVLSSILGNEKYIFLNTKSPYYNYIDLEFAVGKDGIPLSLLRNSRLENGTKTSPSDFSDIRRFAVLVRSKNCYTENDHTLFGPFQMQRRHLEMQGYYVIEILERDFYSMAVATEKDKQILLKKLIMREVVNKEYR
ncbi:FAST kinase domain-containing protein 1, mitochondrial [Armadillidium nasatum]|uniref:FAST kinase domain-containing protein 1, mitochondrial n=1 Tax=Armadillidium nasatum TaxID=96803 RepID=A0A5N5TK45_9CRUS|nr:FAST kinase domain-containing protein 1, mitochondrial [Armadillidium nasatum]